MRMRPVIITVVTVIAAILVSCGKSDDQESSPPSQDATLHFSDITSQTGIVMTPTSGSIPQTQILEVKGGGLALIDFDNDNDPDLFVPNGATLKSPNKGPGCRLYENLGGMRFRDVTTEAGLSFNRWGYGTAVGDYDGDGFDDIYVTCFGPNALLRNTGKGGFVEVSALAGVEGSEWSSASTFGDIDQDGDLDLYVVNYLAMDPAHPPPRASFLGVSVFSGPKGLPPLPDVLYENQGDGTFKNVSKSSGITQASPSYGLGAVMADFDGDHLVDIYVGNDSQASFLFRNLGNGRFQEMGIECGVALDQAGEAQATMGIAIADVDGNGTPDIFTTNFMNDTNTLHVNLGKLLFEDQTQSYGLFLVSRPYLGWATGFFDFDNDADEDLVVFNGHVYPETVANAYKWEYRQTPLLFERDGRRFRPAKAASAGVWLDEKHCDRSATFGDLDADGDIDMIVTELNGPLRVLRNDRDGGDWLIVALHDPRPGHNHRGLGSSVVVRSSHSKQRRWIIGGTSFLAANQLIAHFGLPQGTRSVTLEVTWNDGHKQILENVPSGHTHVVERQ